MHKVSLQAEFCMNNVFLGRKKNYLVKKFGLERRIDDTNIMLNLCTKPSVIRQI